MPDFNEELTKWLLLCCRMLKGKRMEELDGETVNLWQTLLESESVGIDEMAYGFRELVKSETFFPTPNEFLKIVRRSRPSFAVIKDPVDVLTEEGPAVASRKAAENQELPILENDQKPSLQVTPEQREAAAKRLENAESGIVAQAKEKRVKMTDALAECKSLPKPSTPEEIDDRKKFFRSQMESRA